MHNQKATPQELEVIRILRQEAKVLRKSPDPWTAKAAAEWEIFLSEQLAKAEEANARGEDQTSKEVGAAA